MTTYDYGQPTDQDVPPDDADRHRPDPSIIEAERAVVGACLLGNDMADAAAEIVSAGDFFDMELSVVFLAATELSGSGKPVDIVTVQHHLAATGQMGMLKRSGPSLLADLFSEAPAHHPGAVAHHAQIVANDALRRRVFAEGVRIARQASNPGFEPEEVDGIIARLQSAGSTGVVDDEKFFRGPQIFDFLERIEATAASPFLKTPWPELDQCVRLKAGQLILVAAKTSGGKSLFGLGAALHCALEQGYGALIMSLEMDVDEILYRAMASLTKISAYRIECNALEEADWANLTAQAGRVATSGLAIAAPDSLTLATLRARLRDTIKHSPVPVRLVVVDYLQLMKGEGKSERRDLEVGALSRGLRELAREFRVCIMAMVQMNRASDGRADPTPILSDLRESGSLEQDANVVLFLHHPTGEDAAARAGEVDLIVAKNRGGAKTTMPLAFRGHLGLIDSMLNA